MPKYKVFVSYCREHKNLATLLATACAEGGPVFLDCENIKPGEPWEERIESALKEAELVLLLWCCHATERPWVPKELQLCREWRKRVKPILLCSAPLDEYCSRFQWFDYRADAKHGCNHDNTSKKVFDVSGNEVPLIMPGNLRVELGLQSLSGSEIDAAWNRLVRHYRFGAIFRIDELWYLSVSAILITTILTIATDGKSTVALVVPGVAAFLLAVVTSVRRWLRFSSLEKIGLKSTSTAKLLAITLKQLSDQESTSPRSTPNTSTGIAVDDDGCGCGCLIIVIVATLVALTAL
jgi:hypothetical protein